MVSKRKIAAALGATAIITLMGAGGAQAQDQTGGERPHGCTDSGSAGNENSRAKYVALVCKGKVYALTVDERTAPGTPVGGWVNVGAPRHVTDVSVASNTQDVVGGPVFITVLTENGRAYEGSCAAAVGQALGPCTFTQLPKPPH